MKRKIFLMLVVLLVLCICNKTSEASSNFTYTYNDAGQIIITAYKGTSSSVVIPGKIDGKKVVKIAEHAFDENRNETNGKIMKKVVVSEGITTIGDFAFIDCVNLEAIKLPSTLTYMGDQTFIGCTNLRAINVPSKVTSLRTYVFQETGLTTFTIPSNITHIGSGTFRICKSLKAVKVYSKNVVYEDNVFEHCSEDLVLYGYKGSTTQQLAEKNNIKFKVLTSSSSTNTKVSVKSVSFNKKALTLKVGQYGQLIHTILPKNATNKKVKWASSDEKVVIVKNGKLLAKSVGEAVIVVATYDGIKKAYCKVTVTQSDKEISSAPPATVAPTDVAQVTLTPSTEPTSGVAEKTNEEETTSTNPGANVSNTQSTSPVVLIIIIVAAVIILTLVGIIVYRKIKKKREENLM